VFAGSYFVERKGQQQYAGDLQDAIISIVPFKASVVQYATQTSNPYADEKFGLALGPNDIGPVGTQATLVFSPWDRTGGEPAEK
jgi:hypothetical protein